MRVKFILPCFLLFFLLSILLSVSNRSFLLLQIVEIYNEKKQIEYSLRQQ